MTRAAGSFDTFVAASTASLLGYARALTRGPDDAWDLVQETLTRMGERWDRHPVDQPAAYARTVMVRLNIDRVRRIRRDLQLLRRHAAAPAVHPAEEPDTAWLTTALATLTPAQRTALALRFVDDLSTADVAARMGCSAGTARSHLSRGLARLRAAVPVSDVQEVP